MLIKKATRTQAKLRIGLFAPSGGGKTMSALKLARGLTDGWEEIAVIDTERGSADLYADLGPYNTITLDAPFTPERYIEALKACEAAGMKVIIIDSISHEWEGPGGCLQIHEQMTGNSYINWAKVTPRHNNFINAVLQSGAHVICCGRTKQDYVLQERNGKQVPEKVGLKMVTREGFDYEMTLCFDLDIKHTATSSKDRTGLFMDQPGFIITEETGQKLLAWVNSGSPDETADKQEIILAITKIKQDYKLSPEDLQTATGLTTVQGASMDELRSGYERLMEYCLNDKEAAIA